MLLVSVSSIEDSNCNMKHIFKSEEQIDTKKLLKSKMKQSLKIEAQKHNYMIL
jgi:hypothetical protein